MTHADPFLALAFYGLVLLVFCACGAAAERWLFPRDGDDR